MTPSLPEKRPPHERPRVLVVEDDVSLRDLAVIVISEAGYMPEAVGDGASAFAALETRAHAFHALVLDLGLPDVPGRLILRRAKQLRQDLPVIVVTGRADADVKLADVFVAKPFGPADLVAALDAVARRG